MVRCTGTVSCTGTYRKGHNCLVDKEIMADDFTVVKNERGKVAVWTCFFFFFFWGGGGGEGGLKKRKSDNQIDEKVAVCTTCNAQVKMAGGGTSNMQAHMRRHHSSMLTSKPCKMPKHTDQCSPVDQGKSQHDVL